MKEPRGLKSRAKVGVVAAVVSLITVLTACADVDECPDSVAGAESDALGEDTFVGAGYVIRFVASPERQYRGYDVNIVQTLAGSPPFMDTAFLRIDAEVPGITDGQLVLMVAEVTDRSSVFLPGQCVPLVVIPESSLDE